MDYNILLNKACEIQQTHSYGLNKDLNEYAFTFVYPPPQSLYTIDETELLKRKNANPVNIYIHIPYCTGKCTYCYFCRYDLKNPPISKAEYIDLLCKEIHIAKEKLGYREVNSIHIGGGTPTTLTAQEFNRVFDSLHANFSIPNDIEITCESSPETITLQKIQTLVALGVNRLNIGVQSFNDNVLVTINRRHSAKQAKEAIALAQSMGLHNINIDLMYGLPGQSLTDWIETLQEGINAGVQSISTYRLRVHPKGELGNTYRVTNSLLDRYVKLIEIMDNSGFIQVSSHKFAKQQEFMQKQILSKRGIRNNDLLSFGLSSYGYLNNVLYWNQRHIEAYKACITKGKLPCSMG